MEIFFDKNRKRGLSYIETVISIAIFAAVATMLYSTYERVFVTARASQARVNAIALADEQFEVARNLPFAKVGTVGGIPAGVMKQVQTLTRAGMTYIATTTVRNIDQPFDGTAGGAPNDLSPADNKLIEIDITCVTCVNFRPLVLTSWIGPKDLEGSSTNGSLFVQAIDSNGLAISGVNVNIVATSTVPPVSVSDVTATSGLLQLIDAPPANEGYQISVSKSGYSSERTYAKTPTTTNPVKPNATIIAQTVTQLTFAIDRTSTLNFSSVSPSCGIVPNVNLHMNGTKIISTSPDVLKYDQWMTTNGGGQLTLSDIEWDSYTLTATSSAYELAGVMPLQPFTIAPGSTQNVQLVMMPKDPPSVLVTVKDAGTGLPVTGATVTLDLSGASTTMTTGRGFMSQTDWSGGGGQSDFVVSNQYATDDGNVDAISVPGQVTLLNALGVYQPSGVVYSSTFDTGSASNFYQFLFQPTNQPAPVGETPVEFQIASGNSTSSWTYLGPDGTAATFYNATTTDISAVNNGNRYLRYKLLLSTASSSYTPSVSDIQFTFTSSCVPPGQVLFQDLTPGTYDVIVSKAGYTTGNDTVTVAAGTWQEKQISIGP